MAEKISVYETLSKVDTKSIQEKKNGLTYLSWSYALDELFKRYPDATYEIKHWDGKPYLEDDNLGYMVETSVTVEEITHEMWLPVMDFRNKAMPVGVATMTDINKTIMRCLTKNISMFGLGINIYAGSDLPLGIEEGEADMKERMAQKKPTSEAIDESKVKALADKCASENVDVTKLCAAYKVESLSQLNAKQYKNIIDKWNLVKDACEVTA